MVIFSRGCNGCNIHHQATYWEAHGAGALHRISGDFQWDFGWFFKAKVERTVVASNFWTRLLEWGDPKNIQGFLYIYINIYGFIVFLLESIPFPADVCWGVPFVFLRHALYSLQLADTISFSDSTWFVKYHSVFHPIFYRESYVG